MVVDPQRPLWKLFAEIWVQTLPIVVFLAVVVWLDLQYHLEEFQFPISIITVLGTVLGLVLAFRTNSAYARWWEARTLWGAIVNDSRTWVRQLQSFCVSDDPEVQTCVREMSLRQSAWCYALGRFLRGQDSTQDLSPLLAATEIDSYEGQRHVPNALLLRQGRLLSTLFERGAIDAFQRVELERTLVRLTNAMGGCERIKNTPFPPSYSRLVHATIFVFTFFLPFGLVQVPVVVLFFTALVMSLCFLLIEQVAIYLQQPFGNLPSDTPVLALSRTIEINIRQMLGDSELPEPMKPERGILY